MRFTLLSATAIVGLSCTAAWAQEGQYSHTLNEQLQRVQQGQAAVPQTTPSAIPPAMQQPLPSPNEKTETIDSTGGGGIPALPLSMQSNNGINYITGGIGDEELAELKSMEKDFNLHLLLSATDGDYISEAKIHITDSKNGEVLTADNIGPYFYAKLAAGTYNIEVDTKTGSVKKSKIRISGSGATKQVFRFAM